MLAADRCFSALLLSRGARLNILDAHGYTPLMVAAKRGDVVIVDQLVRAGAEVDAPHAYGRTALTWAVKRGCQSVLQCLRLKAH